MLARRKLATFCGGVVFVLFCLFVPAAASAARAGEPVAGYLTTADLRQTIAPQPGLRFAPGMPVGDTVISVDPTLTAQRLSAGFGVAMTDTSAYELDRELPASLRDAVMRALFSPTSGIGLSFLRLPMAGTDYVVGGSSYSYDDMPAGKTDPALARFSVAHDVGYVFPLVREALALNPRMSVMANPWSPPAWMKADDRFVSVGPDGTLLPQYYGVYAQYLVRSLTAFAAAGIPVRYLGVQNEPYTPLLLVSGIPNSFLSGADEGRLIADYVAPALRAAQLGAGILAYDDAFQRSESFVPAAMTVAGSDIRGLAYHCYLSDESSMSLEHDLYPQQPAFETECASNLSNIAPAQMTIRSLRNWAEGVQLWNAALDQHGGPKIGNGCQGLPGTGPNAGQPCIAPVIVNTQTHTYSFTADYWALAQFSRFIRLGAVRIGSSDPSNCIDSPAYPPPCGVEDVAMRNPDGSEVLVATSNDGRAHRLVISEGGQSFAFTLPDGGTVTFVWPAPANSATPLSGARCQSHRVVVFHLPRGARHVVLTLDGHRTSASPRGRALRLTLAGRPRSAVRVLITARVGARSYTRLTTLHPCQPRVSSGGRSDQPGRRARTPNGRADLATRALARPGGAGPRRLRGPARAPSAA